MSLAHLLQRMQEGAFHEVIPILRSDLLTNPSPEKKFLLGKAYMGIQDWKQAITAFEASSVSPSLKERSLQNLAICSTYLGDLETSEHIFQELYKKSPTQQNRVNWANFR